MSATGSPSRYWFPITPSDVTNIPEGETTYLYVGGGGNITAICNGTAVLFSNLQAGYHPIRCTRINVTGTAATLIVGAR